jgi:putative lipase involved disintegration of autophagic bodies
MTGHSLGAGTAALLSIILHDEYNIPIQCFAFAPPGIVSLDISGKYYLLVQWKILKN